MKQYLDLLQNILDTGVVKKDRTGVGTKSVFGTQLKFDLRDGFPAMTTKKLAWKAVVSELLWFIEGSSNEHRLAEIKSDNKPYDSLTDKEKHTIWTDNYEHQGKDLGYIDGNLGPIYGHQWRHWDYCEEMEEESLDGVFYSSVYTNEEDQLQDTINEIRLNPWSRRLIVSAWNAAKIDDMALPPCHVLYQFVVEPDENNEPKYLNLQWYQRSVDCFLGLPFNIASYALLLSIVAEMTDLTPKTLVFSGGDTHIYLNHLEQVKEQLKRTPHKLPTLQMPNVKFHNLDDFSASVKTSDFKLLNYVHDDVIKAPMAV